MPLMSLACKDRRFFVSDKGHMDLAPRIAQAGDKICLVPGYCCPFVIRETDPSDSMDRTDKLYHLVGECYVQDVMDGELAPRLTDEAINIKIV